MTRMYNKKGQFYILSFAFLFSLLIFIYSAGTDNTYIVKSTKFNIVENIEYETCQIGYLSNGSFIESRYDSFEANVSSYCNSIGISCILSITNHTPIPSNLSLLNYTYYNYSINFNYQNYSYVGDFTC